ALSEEMESNGSATPKSRRHPLTLPADSPRRAAEAMPLAAIYNSGFLEDKPLSTSEIDVLNQAILKNWSSKPGDKAKGYIGKFFNRVRIGAKITAQVVGNHGTYTVSIQATDLTTKSACSCYIGKGGYCHHCAALAATFLNAPDSFVEKIAKKLDDVRKLEDVTEFLQSTTLESLLAQLKEKGISQKTFAASIGMSTQHLSAVKSSELNNRFYHELGATKLACLWILERYGEKA
ncbi:MAG: hypothetical protein QMD04_02460, partial [Anaerolineales bacterium]|nr:hypothetical protein [Anaerolineales bacterium]